jgi:hypothetical protein
MNKNTRQTIRKYAAKVGAQRYRILCSDEVHFYGRMGWYFVDHNADDLAKQIEADNEISGKTFAELIR